MAAQLQCLLGCNKERKHCINRRCHNTMKRHTSEESTSNIHNIDICAIFGVSQHRPIEFVCHSLAQGAQAPANQRLDTHHPTSPHPQNQYNPTPHHVYQTTQQDNNTDPLPLGKSLSAHSHTQHLVVPNRSWSVCVFCVPQSRVAKSRVCVWCVREIARAL